MNMIEVRATMSFESFKAGRLYQVDGTDSRVQALIHGRYFSVVHSPEPHVVDFDRPGPGAAGDLGPGSPGKPKKKKAVDGQGDHQPGGSELVHPAGDHATSAPDGEPD